MQRCRDAVNCRSAEYRQFKCNFSNYNSQVSIFFANRQVLSIGLPQQKGG